MSLATKKKTVSISPGGDKNVAQVERLKGILVRYIFRLFCQVVVVEYLQEFPGKYFVQGGERIPSASATRKDSTPMPDGKYDGMLGYSSCRLSGW